MVKSKQKKIKYWKKEVGENWRDWSNRTRKRSSTGKRRWGKLVKSNQKKIKYWKKEVGKTRGTGQIQPEKDKYWKKEVGKTGGTPQIQPEKDQVLEKGGRENWRGWSNPTRKRSSTGKRR